MIVRQHLFPKQKEILDHRVRLCLIFCYLQWTLLLKTTTFFGIRHQSLFALMNLNMWDYIWYDIKILPWMKESVCIVAKVANGKSIFHVSISRELRYISTGDLPWITIKSSPSEGWPSPCLCVRQKVISSPPCLPSLPPTKRSLSNFVFASSATLSLAYIVIFAWFDIVAFAREISWVSRMDHPSVDTMFNYHILWEWQKNSHFHIKIQEDRKKWFASRSIILYPWNSRSQKLKKDMKIVMKLSLCQRDTLQHFLGATRQDGLVSAFVWPTRV